MRSRLTIATRGSQLALWQAEHVKQRLLAADPSLVVELLIIKTTGDKIIDRPLAKVGGKGLFVKEIEQALLSGDADLAVHSMKDVPADLLPGLVMVATSEREDPRDALVARGGLTLDTLPAGAKVGTSSLRRMCQVHRLRPDLELVPLRGNVPTRMSKVETGELDAVVLAAAGIVRLGRRSAISQWLEPAQCLPAAGQGALGIEVREGDDELAELLVRTIEHRPTALRVAAERGFLSTLGGGCQTPIAAYAELADEDLHLLALVGRPDGSEVIRGERRGVARDARAARALGMALGEELLARGADVILRDVTLS